MTAQDRINAKFQYFTLLLLTIIVRRLLYPSATTVKKNNDDRFDLKHAVDFLDFDFGADIENEDGLEEK